jgi:transcriptional antiterminator/mannitol/fructose-specific phosphotransferase system IIA component
MSPHTPEINIRQQNIIRALLNAHGKSTLNELAEKTSLSPRVIRYNMDVVRSWLQCYKVEFINRPGYGIEVVASQQIKSDLLQDLNSMEGGDIVLSRKQRVRIILLNLLTTESPLTAKHLAEVEEFSRSTLFKDIREMEVWLEGYQIKLMRQSSKGMWIEGAEESRRFALARLLHEELGDEAWYRLSRYFLEHDKLSGFPVSARFRRFIETLDLYFSRTLIRYIEENLGVRLAAVSQVEIMVYLAIAISNAHEGHQIAGNADEKMVTSIEYAAAQTITYRIERQYRLVLNDKEKEVIASLIKSSKLDPPDVPVSQDVVKFYEASQSSIKLAQELINFCSMRLHPMIKIDELLINELSNHLDYAIFRLNHHIPIRNAYLKTLQEKYAQIFRVAESSVFLLNKEVHLPIPAEEIGYITMYLLSALERLRTEEDSRLTAVIVNDGVRSKSSLLKSRLEVEFPNLNVTQVINTFQGIPGGKINAEMIISTVPVDNAQLPVIQVSPFLEVDDIKNIQRWIAEKSHTRTRRKLRDLNQQNSLVDLVVLPHVVILDTAERWQDIVAAASQPLIKSGCIQPRYIDAMVDLIENHGFYMYMGSGVLLLHAKPTDGVDELCISLLKLKSPFHFEDQRIPDIDVIFVLGATDDNSHLTSLFQLNELIQFPLFMESIRQAAQPTDVIHTLWKWLPKLPESA